MKVETDKIELSQEELDRLTTDSEGGPARRATGFVGWLTGGACFFVSAYALYWTQFSINTTTYRSSFLALCLALVFILYPLLRSAPGREATPRRPSVEELLTAVMAVVLLGYLVVTQSIADRSPFAFGLALLTGLGFLAYPLLVMNGRLARTQVFDWVFAALALYTAVYLTLNIETYKTRAMRPSADELVLGLVLILLILEATRRTVGWILPAITVLFLIYGYAGDGWLIPEVFEHRGFSLNRIIGQNFLTLEGIFTTPMDVAATFIILFTIYGAVLDRGGAGKFFIDWAFALFGKNPSASAPGRATVASGFLLGTVSGSGVATTVTVASLAWPMLKRAGYPATVGGGMLSAAGIGATLSPPTLGAAAFIIAEFLDVEYIDILIYATIPTILYYVSCWLMTEADSRRLGIKAVRTSNASLWQLTRTSGYHFLSLGAIAVFLALGASSFMAVFWSVVIAFVLSMVRPDSQLVTRSAFLVGCGVAAASLLIGSTGLPRMVGLHDLIDDRASVAAFWGMSAATLVSGIQWWLANRAGRSIDPAATRMIEGLTDGARGTLGIVATCACAGIIVSIVNLSGIGQTISTIMINAGGGNVFLILLMAAFAMWILGLSVPVTASYIIAAVMLVPALVKVGVPPAAAHMFMFYYAVLADVSPPTALAPFAASAITGGSPFATTMQAWKYTLPAFLVPFMFCLTPEGAAILMLAPVEGANGAISYLQPGELGLGQWGAVLWVTITSCLSLVGFCVMFTGYARDHATWVERILCLVGGCLLLIANVTADFVGFGLLVLGLGIHWLRTRGSTAARA
ncbi:MAG: TRAP transporter fused permease subunit [Alphaproteobacteria bacterium]|nr:MAG: TRAP transporter fused permease subunit [Alphaproteobacteria bacterium]